jgi:hypothetical protein
VAIRQQIGEIRFENWFAASRQTAVEGSSITVELPKLQTKASIDLDYLDLAGQAALAVGISGVKFAVSEAYPH